MAVPALTTPAAGHALSASEWEELYSAVRWALPTAAVSTTEESAATDAWRNHPELFAQVEANSTWEMTFKCFYHAGGTDDMACRFVLPTGTKLSFGAVARWAGDSGVNTAGYLETIARADSSSLTLHEISGTTLASTFTLYAEYSGTLVVAGTGGTMQLQFAKLGNATAEVARIRKHSALILRRIG
jgi:hypothetical protein